MIRFQNHGLSVGAPPLLARREDDPRCTYGGLRCVLCCMGLRQVSCYEMDWCENVFQFLPGWCRYVVHLRWAAWGKNRLSWLQTLCDVWGNALRIWPQLRGYVCGWMNECVVICLNECMNNERIVNGFMNACIEEFMNVEFYDWRNGWIRRFHEHVNCISWWMNQWMNGQFSEWMNEHILLWMQEWINAVNVECMYEWREWMDKYFSAWRNEGREWKILDIWNQHMTE